MKVVLSSNYDDETYQERFMCEELGSMTREEATVVAAKLNNECDSRGPDYYKVVEDDYKLHTWEP
jgi:hypothetical protein